MRRLRDDCIKRRLTERNEIAIAVEYLLASGVAEDRIAVVLSRRFYVDVDELNAVLSETRSAAAAARKPQRLGAAA